MCKEKIRYLAFHDPYTKMYRWEKCQIGQWAIVRWSSYSKNRTELVCFAENKSEAKEIISKNKANNEEIIFCYEVTEKTGTSYNPALKNP